MALDLDYDGDGAIDKTIHYVMKENSTALALLNETCEVTTESTDWGLFIIEIDDVTTNYDVEGTRWKFEVNGEMADVALGNYVLQDGDVVTVSLAGAEKAAEHVAATSENQTAAAEAV